jgi:hypothetical protein
MSKFLTFINIILFIFFIFVAVIGSSPPPESVPITRTEDNILLINGTANNSYPITFQIDTGSELTVLYDSFLKKNNIQVPKDAESSRLTGIGGKVKAYRMFIDLKFKDRVLPHTPVLVIPDPGTDDGADGFLGMDLINHTNIMMGNEDPYIQ